MQSVAGNSRVLDTLDTKLRVEAYYQSGSLPPAVEQLESGARNSQLHHLDVQLEAVPGYYLEHSRCVLHTPPRHLLIPPARRSQMAAPDRPVGETSLPIPCWPGTVETVGFRRLRIIK